MGVPHGERLSVVCFDELEDARWNRRARLTAAHSNRADRLKPNIVFSKRDSYQRRGHLTVSKVESYRLTLPRTSRNVEVGIKNVRRSETERLRHTRAF